MIPSDFIGLFGLLSNPIFRNDGVLMTGSEYAVNMLIWNSIGAAILIVYNTAAAGIHFYLLDKANLLRVPVQAELAGLDIIKHREPAYGFGSPDLESPRDNTTTGTVINVKGEMPMMAAENGNANYPKAMKF